MSKNGIKEQAQDGKDKITGLSEVGENDNRSIVISGGRMQVFGKNGMPISCLSKAISSEDEDDDEGKVRTK